MEVSDRHYSAALVCGGRQRRPLSPGDLFKGKIESRNEKYVNIQHIVKANGFHLGKGNKNFYEIASIRTLETIYEDYGRNVLDNTLCLIASTCAGIPRASQRECLLGVAEFVHRYGLVDFAERLQDKFPIIWYEYTEAMRVRGSAGSGTSRKKFCRALVMHYNKGIRSDSKKRLQWEE
jgi:hypothetical protein